MPAFHGNNWQLKDLFLVLIKNNTCLKNTCLKLIKNNTCLKNTCLKIKRIPLLLVINIVDADNKKRIPLLLDNKKRIPLLLTHNIILEIVLFSGPFQVHFSPLK